MTWPLAIVIVVVVFCSYAILDTWLKLPYLKRRVGDLEIVVRGEEARRLINDLADNAELEREGATDAR